ncbi:MAG TPA: hypothetical protein VL126_09140 [Bacteroidota bacterium]|nr:hypothetical protein [Bacteroidota bacterium]
MVKPNARVFALSVIRLICVAGAGIGIGCLFFRTGVFAANTLASQFLTSSVTAALAYAGLRSGRPRETLAALCLWYVVLSVVISHVDSWVLIVRLVYVLGVAAGVSLYLSAVKKNFLRGITQRLAAMGIIIALINCLIIFILSLFTARLLFQYPVSIVAVAFQNLQVGTLLGIALGAGMELAEFILARSPLRTPEHPEASGGAL